MKSIGRRTKRTPGRKRCLHRRDTLQNMVKSTGAEYVILGHSERRQYFGESNELLAKKTDTALSKWFKTYLLHRRNFSRSAKLTCISISSKNNWPKVYFPFRCRANLVRLFSLTSRFGLLVQVLLPLQTGTRNSRFYP
jgi:hypothetical protein